MFHHPSASRDFFFFRDVFFLASFEKTIETKIRRLRVIRQTSEGKEGEQDDIPANCTRVSVEVKKPLGLIFEEDGLGGIVVVEVVSEGNSAKTR